jgi:small subunit ribosomal protein S19
MSRSKWKGVYFSYIIYKKYLFSKQKHKFINLYTRSSTILIELLGLHFKLHNGIRFINVFITENKIGFKFGEFSYTRKLKKFLHFKSKIKKKNKKK